MGHLTGLTLWLSVLLVSANCETFSQCQSKPTGVYLPGEHGCRSYIHCNGDRSYEGNCPMGLSFNPLDGTCDDPRNVQCIDEIITPRPNPTPSAPKVICPTVWSDDEVVFLASPDSCSNYYVCLQGSAVPMTCSGNLHFNPMTQNCESPQTANCRIIVTSDAPTIAPSTRVPIPTWSPETTILLSTPARPPTPAGSPTPGIWSTTQTWSPTQTGNPTGVTPSWTPPQPGTTWPPTTTGQPIRTTTPGTPTWSDPITRPSTTTGQPIRTTTPGRPTWSEPITRPTTWNPTGTTPTWPPPQTGSTWPNTPTWSQPITWPTTTTWEPIRTTTPSTPFWSQPITRPSTTTGQPIRTTTPSTPFWSQPETTTLPSTTTGQPIITTTPHFSSQWPSTTLPPTVPTVDPLILCSIQSSGFYAYPGDCRFFYRCIEGMLTRQECPPGFGWDNNKKYCTSTGCSA